MTDPLSCTQLAWLNSLQLMEVGWQDPDIFFHFPTFVNRGDRFTTCIHCDLQVGASLISMELVGSNIPGPGIYFSSPEFHPFWVDEKIRVFPQGGSHVIVNHEVPTCSQHRGRPWENWDMLHLPGFLRRQGCTEHFFGRDGGVTEIFHRFPNGWNGCLWMMDAIWEL